MKRLIVCAMAVSVIGCGGDEKPGQAAPESGEVSNASAEVGSAVPQESGPITLTAADLDGFEKGIVREAELVREAAAKSASASTPAERGAAIQAGFEDNTIVVAAPVTGLSVERYKVVRETLSRIFTTLDFQGKIDGPQSVDTARADAALKARLTSDPYEALDPAGAVLLKERLSRVAPLWIDYISLTAVNG